RVGLRGGGPGGAGGGEAAGGGAGAAHDPRPAQQLAGRDVTAEVVGAELRQVVTHVGPSVGSARLLTWPGVGADAIGLHASSRPGCGASDRRCQETWSGTPAAA